MRMFDDRHKAGRELASNLYEYAGKDAIVMAIPRGGVVVGYEVAHALRAPLDIIVPRKIGAPFNPELAIGAVAEDGTTFLDRGLVDDLGVSQSYIDEEAERQRQEIVRRLVLYRGDATYPRLEGRTVIIVDDGIATGATIRAALASIKKKRPKEIIVAVPVAPPSTVGVLEKEAYKVVCIETPEPFYAIGQFYKNFEQTSDEKVTRLLRLNRQETGLTR